MLEKIKYLGMLLIFIPLLTFADRCPPLGATLPVGWVTEDAWPHSTTGWQIAEVMWTNDGAIICGYKNDKREYFYIRSSKGFKYSPYNWPKKFCNDDSRTFCACYTNGGICEFLRK